LGIKQVSPSAIDNHDDANPTDSVGESEPVTKNAQATASLRWWPAVMLLLTMLVFRLIPRMFESPSLPVMMIGFMGPAAAGVLILAWWCFASRATGKEKLLGMIGFLVLAGAAFSLIHFSMVGFGLIIMVLPTGLAAFAIGLIALARKPHLRVPVALLLTLFGFGYWDLVQSEGVTGSFEPQLLWRWQPTAEESYLESLAARRNADTTPVASILIRLASAEWPEFRGRDRNGVVGGIVLGEDWSNSPPKELWRTRIGPGWSSFSVAGDRLFTQEQRGEEEVVVCLDANTSNIIWDYSYPSRFWEAIGGAGPRATPTIADEGLFALGASGILVCLDASNGTEVWQRDLKSDADRKPPMWGFAASPLVTDSMVIVHAGGAADKGLFAYAADSGELVWSVASGDHSYSSAQLATFDSTRGILMMTNDGLQFLNVADGATIWEHSSPGQDFRALQPLVLGNSILIATSSSKGTQKITVGRGDDDAWEIAEDWTTRDMKPEFNDYVAYQDHIYGFDGSVFACIDAKTGQRQWKRGRYGNGQVVLLSERGQLLIISEKGELVLLRATPEKLDEVAKYKAIDGKTWNHPVLIGNRIYVRNATEAACFEISLAAEKKSP
jgi:outer membrane protein assembly factor BamB